MAKKFKVDNACGNKLYIKKNKAEVELSSLIFFIMIYNKNIYVCTKAHSKK